MDAAFNFAGKVLELTVEPIARQFGYLIFHGGNVRELKDEVKKLQGQRDSLQHEVDEARRNVEEIEDIVQNWLRSAHEITEMAENFYEEERQAKTECSMRSCPNPWSRYRLSKKAKKITLQVIKLKQERNDFNRISYRKALAPDWVMTSSTKFSRGNEAFDSRVSTMNMIMDALADPTVNMIGLYGLPGVGKSTMAREVADKVQREKLFDKVVVAEVSQNLDYKKIQRDIGDMLGLKFDEESEFARAGRLCERLKQEKNVLVILDDLWDKLVLGKIGIPSIDDNEGNKKGIHSTDDYKGCKIILISTSKEVLSNQMNCKKNVMLGVLSEEEAWQLFKDMAEVQVDSHPDLPSIATDVVKECGGLPIAIVTVARALRNKSLPEWRNALRQLQNPTRRDVTGWRKGVYAPVKLSYNNLETKELKLIFLLSSTWSNWVLTSDLFKYCIGLDVFEGTCTMEDAQDDLHTLISRLKASCLFLDSSFCDPFTMHDIVRDVALSILSDENYALIVRHKKLFEWSEKDQSENYKWISFYQSDIGQFPEKLSCPRLEFFHFSTKDHEMRIPNDFFKELCELKVMDLTGVNLPFLPNSITHLKNLRTLCLDYCELGDISMIGELKKLRALSLLGSMIQQLPRELGELTQLQLIDLRRCLKLKVIPSNVISKLKKLEIVYLGSSFNQWQYDESKSESSANANLSELMDLPNLSTLHIHIPDASMLRKDMFSIKLKKYRIIIGDVWEWSDEYETSRTLKLKLNTSIHTETSGIKKLMDRVEDLFLDEVNGIKSVLSDLNRAGFPHLKRLQIQNNSQIECIINSRQVHAHDAFPMLETLLLENMIQLEKLCDGQLPINSFSKLTVIKVRNCDKLNILFPVSVVRSVPKLDEIEVSGCKLMQEIVDLSDQEIDDEGTVEFHQLRILRMSSLPALVGFCSDDKRRLDTAPWKEKQFESASRSNVKTKEDRPNPSQHLFSNKVAFPNLETLKLSTMNFQNIWRDSISASSGVQNLTDLSIEGCGSIRYIMPTALARCFVKLKHLNICRCEMVEMIIFPNIETSNAFGEEVIFPSLETMVISNMESLQIIWQNQFAPNSYGKIKKVEISYCEKLITIIPSHMLRTLNHLETLTVSHCDALDTIFDVQGLNVGQSHGKLAMQLRNLSLDNLSNLRHIWNNDSYSFLSFGSLRTVHVVGCECLRRIFSASMVISLVQLEKLNIESCGIEEIVGNKGKADADISFVLPRMDSLRLWDLSKLKRFYPGKYTLDCPELKELNVIGCDKMELFEIKPTTVTATHDRAADQVEVQIQQRFFHLEKVIPHLEFLSLNGKDFLEICQGKFQEDLFHSIRYIRLQKFESKAVQFPYWFLHKMPNLQLVILQSCSYKEIFPSRSLVAEERQTADVVRLESLHLHDLPRLEYICKEGLQLDPVLEKLELLHVLECSGLKNLIPASTSFNCLTILGVSKCHGLVNLIAPSTAKSLFHLTKLIIEECKMLQEIIAKVEDGTEDEISFRRLEYLELTHLPSLISFCAENYSFDFPCLEQVIVRQCPRMKIFSQGSSRTPRLLNLRQENDQSSWKGDLNSTIELLFRGMVAFSGMEEMKLDEYPELIDIWEGKLPNWSFSNLKSLILENCDFLSYAIPSYLLNSLTNLEKLKVINCNSVEAVFDLQDIEEPHTLPRLQLKSMILLDLPKLKCVWNKDPQQIDFCQHLQMVGAVVCESLKSIFPASIAKHLPKLEVLNIHSCFEVEVIVERDEVAGADPCFVFPQLSSLNLMNLPNLKNFYSERHTSEWPRLRNLKVYMCKNVEVFGSEVLSTAEAHEKDELEARHPLFSVEKVVPNLEELMLNQKAVTMMRNNQLQIDVFHKMKLLCLEGFNDEPVIFPNSFLERFPNLNELHVICSSFEEIFPCQGAIGNYMGKYAPLKILRLYFLKQLKNIWHSDSQLELLLQSLESLEVIGCSSLINLAPSSASFDNLTNLDVSACDQLIYLVTSSTAKSLVHLTSLKVKYCKMIEEIIADEGENEEKEISFKELECLELTGLPNLKSFCSQDYKFKFPSLSNVTITGCPNMKMFCSGVLATPLLEGVNVEENQKLLEGDLNRAIEQIFSEERPFQSSPDDFPIPFLSVVFTD